MIIEQRCPGCTTGLSRPGPEPRPPSGHSHPRRAGSLTFTCRCGSAATVPTSSGPGRELARRGWTFRFIAP
jgi:hypothetical protein